MNKVILSGNLCKDIELLETPNGTKVVRNTIAVRRDYKDADGQYASDFIDLVVWKQQAEYLGSYAVKGDQIELVGRWTVRTYTNNEGIKRTANECTVESVRILSNKKRDAEQDPEEYPESIEDTSVADGELPF